MAVSEHKAVLSQIASVCRETRRLQSMLQLDRNELELVVSPRVMTALQKIAPPEWVLAPDGRGGYEMGIEGTTVRSGA